jgi:hypothetical protein
MRNKEIAAHLLEHANGYGMAETVKGQQDFYKCIGSIPYELREAFVYTLYRIADKSGSEGFSI